MELKEMIFLTITIITFIITLTNLFLLTFKKNNIDIDKITTNISVELFKNQLELNEKSGENINKSLGIMRTSLEDKVNLLTEKNANNLNNVLESLKQIQIQLISSENQMVKTVADEMFKINQSVEQRLNTGFQQTQLTINNVIERLAVIDQAQSNITNLSQDIIQLQDILQDKKNRGNFGEFQLKQILVDVFGESKDLYELQKELSNKTRVDALIYMPKPNGNVAVDAKFPLENYKRLREDNLGDLEIKLAETRFKADIKKHIDDISNKYIIENETSNQAIMFIPSEAIFYYITANHPELIRYGIKKSVVLTSPTTFIAVLKVIQVVVIDHYRRQNTQKIIDELAKLSIDFRLYVERWGIVKKNIDKVKEEAERLQITNQKITNRFEGLYNLERVSDEKKVQNE